MNKSLVEQRKIYNWKPNFLTAKLTFSLFIFIITISVYLIFTSPYFDEWDSVQFALGLNEFNMIKHQPHPPGYPFYIFLGKLFRIFFSNDRIALNYLSAFSGALGVTFVFLLSKSKFGLLAGSLSSAIMAFTPAYFTASIVAMNDVVALGFILVSLYFIFNSKKEISLLGFFFLGLSLGIRPQNCFISLLIYIYSFFLTKNKAFFFKCIIASAIGILFWLIPAAYLHGGLLKYLQLSSGQLGYVPHCRFEYNLIRIVEAVKLISSGWKIELTILSLIIFISFSIEIVKIINERKNNQLSFSFKSNLNIFFWILWFFIAIGTALTWYCLYISRYILPAIPAVAIIGAWAITNIINHFSSNVFKLMFGSLIFVGLLTTGLNSVQKGFLLNLIPPAPVQAAKHISENYPPDRTVIIHSGPSKRHFNYYLEDYKKASNLNENLLNSKTEWILSAKLLPFAVNNDEDFKEIIFERSREIYPKHEKVILYTFKRPAWIFENIYGKEKWGFWMGKYSSLYIYSETNQKIEYFVTMRAFAHPRRIKFSLNNISKIFQVPNNKLKKISVSFFLKSGWNHVDVYSLDGCDSPLDMGINNDSRCLGIGFHQITVKSDS